MKRLLLAAEHGDAGAQFNVGILYDNRLDDNGHPTAGNRPESIKWLLRAAQQGLARAQNRLAEIYAEDTDAPGDRVKACVWFLLAAANLSGAHRQAAQSGYERLAKEMTPAQIAKVRRLARLWKPTAPDKAAG